jgi:hypothetical protein
MKNTLIVLLLVGLVTCFIFNTFYQNVSSGQGVNGTRWEYKLLDYDHINAMNKNCESDLAKLGKEGWELIILTSPLVGKYRYIFKRPAK